MNLGLIDWTIVVCFFVIITSLAVFTKRYTKSVSDFLTANRCLGRYLLIVNDGMASVDAISVVGAWEMYYRVGFSVRWWSLMFLPVASGARFLQCNNCSEMLHYADNRYDS